MRKEVREKAAVRQVLCYDNSGLIGGGPIGKLHRSRFLCSETDNEGREKSLWL
jgi:hypothetical protein